MTLAARTLAIDETVAVIARANPCASTETVLELASQRLAIHYGLVVTPDEIQAQLSRAAGYVEDV